MANIRLLGTPYVRGKAVAPGKRLHRYRQDAPITIGDTCPGQELHWIDTGELLVAQSEVLTGVSLNMLAASSLTNDGIVSIDGETYKCQLLQVAPREDGLPCEWEDLQQAYPDVWIFSSNAVGIWGKEGAYFNRGGFSDSQPPQAVFGWRPVLEHLLKLSPAMVGKYLFASVGRGSLHGELIELTDYDLVFRDVVATNLPTNHILRLPGGELVLERKAVRQVREA